MRDFSEVLRELRTEKKISQRALGEILGISDRNIRFYETGEHRPDFEGLLILADYFQVSLDIWWAEVRKGNFDRKRL